MINKIVFTSPGATAIYFICNFASISCGFRYLKLIVSLFHQSELRDLKENQIFAEIDRNLPQLAAPTLYVNA